ncbi:MAG: ABC transporter permease subunit [Gemmataceae bacterium]|nr:ABC transporter permease subunit [Gemmataceae bacterium]
MGRQSVYFLEWLNACRRGRHHMIRHVYVGVLVLEVLFYLFSWFARVQAVDQRSEIAPWNITVERAWYFWQFFAYQHFFWILISTPAFVAGAVADEKTRGTLELLLTTDLTRTEIVIGKWLGQVAQVLVFTMPAWPIFVFLTFAGGLQPGTLLVLGLDTLILIMTLAAGGILTSVWARKTSTAVLLLYGSFAAVLYLLASGDWLAHIGFHSFEQVNRQSAGHDWWSPGWLWGWAAGVAVVLCCLCVATLTLRRAFERFLSAVPRMPRWLAWLRRPPVGDQPLRWKERFVGQVAIFAWLRQLPRRWAIALVFVLGVALFLILESKPETYFYHGLVMMTLVSLFVAVRASGAISGEREKHTWDSLLMTPLEARQLVRGKLWGIIDSARPYFLAYLIPALLWSARGELWGLFCTVFCWLASWGLLYYYGASGIYWSVQSTTTYQSLFKTLSKGTGHLLKAAMTFGLPTTAFFAGCVASILLRFGGARAFNLVAIGLILGITITIVQVFGYAEKLLQETEEHISFHERASAQPAAARPERVLSG